MRAYDSLVAHFEKINHFEGARSMLHWDGAAMMPMGGAEARSGQISALSVLIHQMTCDPKVKDWLNRAEAEVSIALRSGDAHDLLWAQANLFEIKRAIQHASAVPENLVQALSEAGSKCEMIWREARAEDDFKRLQPYLEEVLKLTREVASIKAEALGVTPYEALLDQYEPGASESSIDAAFAQLSLSLPSLIEEALEAQARRDEAHPIPSLFGPFAVQAQRELGLKVMDLLGFDFDHGRLDISHHPFCGGTPSDVRITTRYNEQQFTQSLMGVIHETGHALYEQGLPKAYRNLPVGKARGMSVHESQSLFWEMQVGRSEAFISVLAPLVAEAFGGDPLTPSWGIEGLRREYTKVERSLIRVDADEVTYPAHVILRYDLERSLLGGDLEIADLPEAWNSSMQRLVGITPPSNRDGCMQDIHWMDGAFGYFPTYTLGAMTAAQLFESVKAGIPDVHEQIRAGELQNILTWLRDNVHSHGSSLSTDDLLTQATGRPLEVAPFLKHLRTRYVDEVMEGVSRAPTPFSLTEEDVQLSNTGVHGTEEVVNDALELVSDPPQPFASESEAGFAQEMNEFATQIGAFDGVIPPLGEEVDADIFDSVDLKEMELELNQLEVIDESETTEQVSHESALTEHLELPAIPEHVQTNTQFSPQLPPVPEDELDLIDELSGNISEETKVDVESSAFDSFDDIDLSFDNSVNTELKQELEKSNAVDAQEDSPEVALEEEHIEQEQDQDLIEEVSYEHETAAFEQASTQAIFAHLQSVTQPKPNSVDAHESIDELPPELDENDVEVWSLEGELQLAAELNEALHDLEDMSSDSSEKEENLENKLEAVETGTNELDSNDLESDNLEAQALSDSLDAISYDFGTAIFATPIGQTDFGQEDSAEPISQKIESEELNDLEELEELEELEDSEDLPDSTAVFNASDHALAAVQINATQDSLETNELNTEDSEEHINANLELSSELDEILGEQEPKQEIDIEAEVHALEAALDLDLGLDPGPSAYELTEDLGVDLSEAFSDELANALDAEPIESNSDAASTMTLGSAQEAIDLMDSYQPLPGSDYARPTPIKDRVEAIMKKTSAPANISVEPMIEDALEDAIEDAVTVAPNAIPAPPTEALMNDAVQQSEETREQTNRSSTTQDRTASVDSALSQPGPIFKL